MYRFNMGPRGRMNGHRGQGIILGIIGLLFGAPVIAVVAVALLSVAAAMIGMVRGMTRIIAALSPAAFSGTSLAIGTAIGLIWYSMRKMHEGDGKEETETEKEEKKEEEIYNYTGNYMNGAK